MKISLRLVLGLALALTPTAWASKVDAFGFTAEEDKVLEKAMSLFNQRFLQKNILRCTLKNQRWYEIRETYLDNLVNKDFWMKPENGHGLLAAQLHAMNAQFDKKGADFMPDVEIHKFEDDYDGDAVAYAYPSDQVVVENETTAGKFKVYVSKKYLNSTEAPYTDVNYWASALGHEFLHNLGHSHPKNDYRDSIQMIAFERCLRTNGEYDGRDELKPVTCTSRTK